MGHIDLILNSKSRTPTSSLIEPEWELDSRVPEGKLTVEQFNWDNSVNIVGPYDPSWKLIDHLPTGSNAWFAREDDIGYRTDNPPTAAGSITSLGSVFTAGGTMESNCPGYDQILLTTIDKSQYWVISKQQRDLISDNADGNGTYNTIKSSDGLDSLNRLYQHFSTTRQPQLFRGTDGTVTTQIIYNEASFAHVDYITYPQLGYQIWIRNSKQLSAVPMAILHTGGSARDSLTTSITRSNKFQYIHLFVPYEAAHSMRILQVRLLNNSGNNVFQDNTILVPTDAINSLAVGTNPSAKQVKASDDIADIIDNKALTDVAVGDTTDTVDEVVQLKLNRAYSFDEFRRLEVYFKDEQGPYEIRFLNENYELINNNVLYTSESPPSFAGTNNTLIILKMLGANPMTGFTAGINDTINTYVLAWADESTLTTDFKYRKVAEVDSGILLNTPLLGLPPRNRSLALVLPSDYNDTSYTDYQVPSNDGDYGWKLIDHISPGENRWFKRVDDFGFVTSVPPTAEGSLSDLSNRFTRGGTMESICSGYDQLLLKTVNTYDGAFGNPAGDLYYIFSRTERDRVMALTGSNTTIVTLASYDGNNLFAQQFNVAGGARPFISFPNFAINRCIYQEAHAGDIPDKMLTYGLQIWIRNSRYGNTSTQGSYEPQYPLVGVQKQNDGRIGFKFEKTSGGSPTVSQGEIPSSYSLKCKICTC